MSEKITHLTLINGEQVPIQTPISLFDWKRAKKDKLLTDNAFAMAMRNGGGNPNLNDKDLENAPFVAYRAAGGNLSQQEFEKSWAFDISVAGQIYGQIVGGTNAKKAHSS